MPISVALSKFLSCNDIILLVVHFMLILNLNCYIGIHILKTISSLAQKCRLNDSVYKPTYLALAPPPLPPPRDYARTSYNLMSLRTQLEQRELWCIVCPPFIHCFKISNVIAKLHISWCKACMVTSVQLQLLLCKRQCDSRSARTYIYYHNHINWFY